MSCLSLASARVQLLPLLVSYQKVKPRRLSRVGMMYERYLGLMGQYYEQKLLLAQAFIIVLQAPTKLPLLGAAAWVAKDSVIRYFFYVYLGGLAINCVYPSMLLLPLRYNKPVRIIVAAIDAVLDFVYSA